MTELETLERAKMYMEKLANGINPIDGSVIPDEDIVNNVRLSRCFFYVSDVLRQVIENGGVTPQKKIKKEPFSLTVEQREAFEFSAIPMPISEISKRINALSTNENMSTLSYAVIRDWLMSLGMLEYALDGNGKNVVRPTPQGEGIGIALEARNGANGANLHSGQNRKKRVYSSKYALLRLFCFGAWMMIMLVGILIFVILCLRLHLIAESRQTVSIMS